MPITGTRDYRSSYVTVSVYPAAATCPPVCACACEGACACVWPLTGHVQSSRGISALSDSGRPQPSLSVFRNIPFSSRHGGAGWCWGGRSPFRQGRQQRVRDRRWPFCFGFGDSLRTRIASPAVNVAPGLNSFVWGEVKKQVFVTSLWVFDSK